MTTGDEYRALAAEFERRARIESDPVLKSQWHRLATANDRLAALADEKQEGGLLIDFSLPEKPLDS
jgi:hypothetical protein